MSAWGCHSGDCRIGRVLIGFNSIQQIGRFRAESGRCGTSVEHLHSRSVCQWSVVVRHDHAHLLLILGLLRSMSGMGV